MLGFCFLNVPIFLIFELLATPGAHKTAPADIQPTPSIPHIALSVQYHSIMILNVLRRDLKHSKTLYRH